MNELGQLYESSGQYEYRDVDKGILVRGEHPEWVLMAAAEMISSTSKAESESKIDELQALVEFEAATEIELDSARYQHKERFEIIPQCLVKIGSVDYRWAAPEGRKLRPDEFGGNPVARVHDMSLTHNDSFLENDSEIEGFNDSEMTN